MNEKINSENMILFLNITTTGYENEHEELIEIAIIDNNKKTLLNTLVKPLYNKTWPNAEKVHGITPAMVSEVPTLAEVAPQIEKIIKDQTVVIYDAGFHSIFLGTQLFLANSILCCMKTWLMHHNGAHWKNKPSLSKTAKAVCFEQEYRHQALWGASACRAIWQYLTNSAIREKIDSFIKERKNHKTTYKKNTKKNNQKKKIMGKKEREKSAFMTRFIEHWWLRRYGCDTHWTKQYSRFNVEPELAMIFFGKSLESLELESKFTVTYENKKNIPKHLKPASFFPKAIWFQEELVPYAAYVGKKKSWPLYHVTELERIKTLYPLRLINLNPAEILTPNETLMTRVQLRKKGYSNEDIDKFPPFAEKQNPTNQKWYFIYKIEKDTQKDN
ncbi:3'-5' exonuclease [Xenorhabdus bovienii]|uniref:3'-5' exonuclease n=1 Tax=Xenorhabdus bovienii TaxID=40576 RepID=UPI003DA68830